MNETSYYEYRDLILSATDTITGQYTFYVSLVSAFLVVTYVVGKQLTRFQVTVLTLIYSLMALQSIGGLLYASDQHVEFLQQAKQAYPELIDYEGGGSLGVAVAGSSLFAGFLMSLLFMWLIRRRRTA